ncbi:MAG: energy-coupling factor ABC transporter permease, partial [Calditerrivibrio sp.]|nr:energy-coupling factor ABC transporter permease [Calditerrivibrio sp.]
VYGTMKIKKTMNEKSDYKLLLGFVAAFCFVLSSLKIPSVTGSCSHPTGVGLGAILFGASVMVPIGFIVLLFQAILIAHGGITTLGANLFSMGIVGPFVAYFIYHTFNRLNVNKSFSIFFAIFLSDLFTYIVTSFQLALAFPDQVGGVMSSFLKFASIFAITQVPIAIIEGIVGLITLSYISSLVQDDKLITFKKQEV